MTALNLGIGTTAGYAYARFSFPGKTLSLFALLFTRMLPTVVLVPAFFLMLRALGLSNTLFGLVLPYGSFTLPFTVWIMKAYFETVPAELDKSALVDGCNRLQAYYRVVLPVSRPGLVAGAAFTFMLCWNEFIVARDASGPPSRGAADQHRSRGPRRAARSRRVAVTFTPWCRARPRRRPAPVGRQTARRRSPPARWLLAQRTERDRELTLPARMPGQTLDATRRGRQRR